MGDRVAGTLNHSISVTSVAMRFINNSCQPFTKITCLVVVDLFHQPK
jgi:hypothetical protein